MSISVPKRREGHISVLARSRKLTCPASITEKLLSLLPLQDPKASLPIIRRIVKTKKQERFHDLMSISYTTALDTIRSLSLPLYRNLATKQFATHSLKSGGASNAGFKRMEAGLKDRHGEWKDSRTKRRYFEKVSQRNY